MNTDILNRIIEMIEETSNDMELGEKIRKLYWELKNNLHD